MSTSTLKILIGWIYFLESFSLFYFIIPVPFSYIYLITGTGMHLVSSVLALYYFGYYCDHHHLPCTVGKQGERGETKINAGQTKL